MSPSSQKTLRAPWRAAGALLIAGFAVGCGSKTLDISVEQTGCEGISEGEVPDSSLVQTTRGSDIVVYRDWVMESSTAEFDPEFAQSRKEIEIHEYWTDEGSADSVETCFRPTVIIHDPDPGKFTLFWFVGDDGTPFDNVLIEVE